MRVTIRGRHLKRYSFKAITLRDVFALFQNALTLKRKVTASYGYRSGLIEIVIASYSYRSGLIGIIIIYYSYRSKVTISYRLLQLCMLLTGNLTGHECFGAWVGRWG
jgi:hypothetical protein